MTECHAFLSALIFAWAYALICVGQRLYLRGHFHLSAPGDALISVAFSSEKIKFFCFMCYTHFILIGRWGYHLLIYKMCVTRLIEKVKKYGLRHILIIIVFMSGCLILRTVYSFSLSNAMVSFTISVPSFLLPFSISFTFIHETVISSLCLPAVPVSSKSTKLRRGVSLDLAHR